jgi:hypothetical protein
MSSKLSKKSKSVETDGRLVQTRIPPEDYLSVEMMAKASRLSMASMLRTMIASQADAYRAAQKSASFSSRASGKGGAKVKDDADLDALGELLGSDLLASTKIVNIVAGPEQKFGGSANDGDRVGIGIYALTAAGDLLALCKRGLDLHWVKVPAARDDLDVGTLGPG